MSAVVVCKISVAAWLEVARGLVRVSETPTCLSLSLAVVTNLLFSTGEQLLLSILCLLLPCKWAFIWKCYVCYVV